ncbi:MAG TPA: hypothetical protein VE631_08385 [Alphaproteobacteria bacterium]|jgi:hypothetical protein|nr:hypothetical protein [Alphaproteobacteria bacterium]
MTMLRAPDRTLPAASLPIARGRPCEGDCGAFEAELEKALRLLRGGQPRGSFLRLRFARLIDEADRDWLIEALGGLGIAGRIRDDSIVLLYIGPRAGGETSEAGDRLVERRLVGRLRSLLGELSGAGPVHVELRHFWCAAITSAAQLLDEPLDGPSIAGESAAPPVLTGYSEGRA